jgi:methyl-accepting chemotaxis protein
MGKSSKKELPLDTTLFLLTLSALLAALFSLRSLKKKNDILSRSYSQLLERFSSASRTVSASSCDLARVIAEGGALSGDLHLRIGQFSHIARAQSEYAGTTQKQLIEILSNLEASVRVIKEAEFHTERVRPVAQAGMEAADTLISEFEVIHEQISDTAGTIKQLQSDSLEIGQVIDIMAALAKKINMVAVNASIEAARAGESGEGFAVVAEEVQRLAHRSRDEAQRVGMLVNQLQAGTARAQGAILTSVESAEHGLDLANNSRASLQDLQQIFESITAYVYMIFLTTEGIAASSSKIDRIASELALSARRLSEILPLLEAISERQQFGFRSAAEETRRLQALSDELGGVGAFL